MQTVSPTLNCVIPWAEGASDSDAGDGEVVFGYSVGSGGDVGWRQVHHGRWLSSALVKVVKGEKCQGFISLNCHEQ